MVAAVIQVPQDMQNAKFTRAFVRQVDRGGALFVTSHGNDAKVMLNGVEVPSDGPEGDIAKKYLEFLVRGQDVMLVREDRPGGGGNWYVFRALDGRWVNRDMILAGYALPLDRELPAGYLPIYRMARDRAKSQRRGLWANDGSNPVNFRSFMLPQE